MIIDITDDDRKLASIRAHNMIVKALRIGVSPNSKAVDLKTSPHERRYQGTLGEIALAKFLHTDINQIELHKNHKDNFSLAKRGHDVNHVEVRATLYPIGKLIVHRNDFISSPFVLAIIQNNYTKVRLAGWIYGHEAKTDKYFNNFHFKNDSWYVGQKNLHDMNTLLGELWT